MTPEDLVAHLESSGVVLAAEGGRLRVNAPRGSLSEELKSAIAESRDDLITLLERRAASLSAPIERIERGSVLPVSSFQERMWILQRMDPQNTDYNIVSVWKSATQFVAERQSAAVHALIGRHEILRSSFDEIGDSIGMRLLPPESVPLEVRDLGVHPQPQFQDVLRALIEEQAHTPFDLTSAPAVRFIICRAGPNEAVTLCVAHHIAVDAWSLSLLEQEFAILCTDGVPPPPALQYADYAAWERARDNPRAMATELQWWARYLSGAPQLSVFAPDLSGSGMPVGATREFDWDADLAAGLRSLVRAEGATIYAALLAACAVVLRWHTGQQEFVLGSPMGARERAELETMIGPFVGLLLIRIDVSDEPTFAELLRRARDSMLEAHAHRQVSFEALLEHLRPPRMVGHSPLFQLAIVQHNSPGSEERMSFSGGTMHEITWFVREAAGGLQCALEFRSDLYSDAAIGRIAAHLEAVLRRAVENPGQPIGELCRLTPPERRQVVEAFNMTAVDVPEDTFTAHFHRRSSVTPDATAIADQDSVLSYRDLDQRAQMLAHRLRDMGVGRGTRVAVCLERSLALVVAVLAIQRAGGAYVPLDPGFPHDRLSFMLSDSGAAVLMTAGGVPRGVALPDGVAVLDVADEAAAGSASTHEPLPMVRAEDPAYIIYTSGSTGRPKGVVVSHGSLMNFLWSMAREPGLAATDILAAVTTISFDIAGLELYLPLLVGARVELISRETAADGAALAARLASCGATVLQATPATWRLLLEVDWRPAAGFRALCGGEGLPRALADALLDRVGELWNLYGPTETTIWSTTDRVERGDGPVTIGRPIGNTQVYIVGGAGEPLPIGVPGEIWIGGAGVALGYHNRPELTAERFVADTFAAFVDARLYRTGDLGRWREDGRIEHLGRIDHQVKIRGFRVELGEIEARLATHEAVRQVVVIAREAAPGDLRLVAYVVFEHGQELTVSDVRRHLRRDLPDYMVPSLVVVVQSMPLTPNGKLDRAALPDPFKQAASNAVAHAPLATPMEELIGTFWRDLLKIERIGAEDNFFDLGGHSLLTLRVAAAIHERTGRRVDPRTHYFQNLRQIAATVDGATQTDHA